MAPEADPAELTGLEPDERLLNQDLASLPSSVGRPLSLVPVPARRLITAAGSALTGVSLLGGIILIVLAAISGLGSGFGSGAAVELAVGLALVATHWGWIHVAEFTAGAVEERGNRHLVARRRDWLLAIEPYTRFSVQTETAPDGSIEILTLRHRPVPSEQHSFTFTKETVAKEVHPGADAAAVAERAELLRRQAASGTSRERERFEANREAVQRAAMAREDDQQQLVTTRAVSQALSEQINANLRDEPLDG